MENSKFVSFFDTFSEKLVSLFPKGFTFSDLKRAITEEELVLESTEEVEVINDNYEWIDEFSFIVNTIGYIIKHPFSSLSAAKEVLPAQSVTRISNSDLQETLKHSDYWKIDSTGKARPEKIFTDVHEDGYDIYENRFIVFMIDRLFELSRRVARPLYSKVKLINSRYLERGVGISEMKSLDFLANFSGFSKGKPSIDEIEDKETLLTRKNEEFLGNIEKLQKIINKLQYYMSTPFYKTLKRSKQVKESDLHVTNIINDNKYYNRVYRYLKTLDSLSKVYVKEGSYEVTPAYRDYVLIYVLLCLSSLGYVFSKRLMKFSKKHIYLEEGLNAVHPKGIAVNVGMNNRYITVDFEVVHKGTVVNSKNSDNITASSSIVFDVSSSELDLDNNDLIDYYKSIVTSRIENGYINAYLVNPFVSSDTNNILYLSPFNYKVGGHLKNVLIGATIFVEADDKIYSSICPVCGSKVANLDENIECPACGSIYSFLKNGEGEKLKSTMWIKRIKTIE